jgi:RNA polymerase sigma-70 factor, ECF subfamily
MWRPTRRPAAGPRPPRRKLDGPPYNLVLHTAPLREQVDATYHWHWEIHPRLREIAGLELGTGLPVNPVSPRTPWTSCGRRSRARTRWSTRRDERHRDRPASHRGRLLRHTTLERGSAHFRAWPDLPPGAPVEADLPELAQRQLPGGYAVSAAWDRDEAYRFVEELFAKHQGEIYAYLLRMLRDPELAADLTQDAFVKAYRAYDSLQKPDNARAWLYQIAHRVALDDLRRRRIVRFIPLVGETRGSAPSAEHLAMDARLSGELQRALERIPERQRSALLLAELHDLTGVELAAALGVSHVAARALLTRARESLRQALAAERKTQLEAEAKRVDVDDRSRSGRRS